MANYYWTQNQTDQLTEAWTVCMTTGLLLQRQKAFTTKLTGLTREHNIGSLQAWQIQGKGEKGPCMSSSSSSTPSPGEVRGKRKGRDQDFLVNGCPQKHCERKLSPPSAFPTKCTQHFSTLLPPWHTNRWSPHTTYIKAQFMHGTLVIPSLSFKYAYLTASD